MKRLLYALILAALPLAADDVESVVRMMVRVGFANTPSFSPDGSRVAFLTNISGTPQAWVVPSAGGWPDQLTAIDDPVQDLAWSPDGRWIALDIAPGGGLNRQIWVVRPDGSGLRRLTEGGKENNWLGPWMPDSKAIVIASNRRDPASMDTWLLDAASGSMTLIAKNPGIGSPLRVSDDGKYVLIQRLRNRGDSDLYRVAIDGGEEVLLTKHTPPEEFDSASFAGSSNDTVYMIGNPDRDRAALGRVRVSGGKASPFEVLLSRDDAELADVSLDPRGELAVLNWNVAGRSELAFYDVAGGPQRPGPKLPSDVAGVADFSDDGKSIALLLSGSNAPTDIWVMSRSGALQQLTRSPHAGVDLASLVRPELVTYRAHDGLALSGWLYRPHGAKPPYATVLSFHGGPEGQERPSFSTTYQALLANGIAVFAPNVRGSAGFGKKFVNLDNGAARVNGVRDIKSTADHLVAAGISDPKRLGIMGGSYGGYMVMAGVTEYPDLFAAGANLFGVVNFETFFQHTEPWMAAISTVEYGDPATQKEMLASLSPIHKVDRVKTPLIVLHGANDTNVPVVEAEQVVNSLKSRNVPVEYVLFPDEGHGWRKTPNRIRSTLAIVNFFKARL